MKAVSYSEARKNVMRLSKNTRRLADSIESLKNNRKGIPE